MALVHAAPDPAVLLRVTVLFDGLLPDAIAENGNVEGDAVNVPVPPPPPLEPVPRSGVKSPSVVWPELAICGTLYSLHRPRKRPKWLIGVVIEGSVSANS